jgi:hypothetical protein
MSFILWLLLIVLCGLYTGYYAGLLHGKKIFSAKIDAHELWAVAQLMPWEGIEDGVRRIEELLEEQNVNNI